MIPVRRFLLASAGSLLLLPFAAVAQSEDQQGNAPPVAEAPAPKPENESDKEEAAEEEKVVCKSVRADPSSRRKTRICRTMEEWRDLNIPT